MSVLLRWIVLRRLLGEGPRTLLTLLGVALGVAVFVAIRLASHSALASFSDTVDAVTGRANLQVTSRSDGFDEKWFAPIREVKGVAAAAPMVEVQALAAASPAVGPDTLAMGDPGRFRESLLILGVDAFSEAPFARGGAAASATPSASDAIAAIRLVAEPRTIAITRTLADRNALAAGDTLRVLASGKPLPLVVAWILTAEDLQQAYGGNVALVDIATAQEVFHRAGRLDRVDLIVAPGERERVRAELRALLPPDVAIDLPQSRTRQVENMVRAFDLNLTALSFIALFVSTFLVFNAVAMSVVRWRREIGILRGLGVTRGGVARLFLLEGLGLGVVGSALGLVLGTWLAGGMLVAVGRTLESLYLIEHTRALRADLGTYALGMGVGIATALLSALAPALEAAGTRPGLTMRSGAWLEAQRPASGRAALAGLACLALAAAVAAWTVKEQQPLGGFASAFLVIVGFTGLAPAATLAGEWLARGPAARTGRIEVLLGVRALREAVVRASVVVAALMVAVGMMVALQVMVGSFRQTVDTWITQTLKGDLYIEPAGHRRSLSATALPPELVERTRAIPGVAAVDTYRATPARFGELPAFVVGIDFDVQRRFGGLAFVSGEAGPAVIARALERGEVLVTESFAHRHRLRRGDGIVLPAPTGPARLRVAGVFYDYSTDAGAVMMDRALFARLWADDRTESLALYLEPGADLDAVRAAFLAAAGGERVFHVTANQTLRARVLHVFDQTFQITYALQGIAVLVAVLGVITTLTALILQRGREIAVLRASGALRAQVRTMVLVESGLLGLIGATLGCLAGLVLAALLVFVINKQFFGWSIRFTLDPWIPVQAVLLMGVTAVVAGFGPARLAASRVAAEAMRLD